MTKGVFPLTLLPQITIQQVIINKNTLGLSILTGFGEFPLRKPCVVEIHLPAPPHTGVLQGEGSVSMWNCASSFLLFKTWDLVGPQVLSLALPSARAFKKLSSV